MKKYYRLNLLFGVFFCFLTGAASANTACNGPINHLYLNPISGLVVLNYGYGNNGICSLNEITENISPEVCNTLYATLLSARMANKNILIKYNGSFGCSAEALGDWTLPLQEAYLIEILD